jgi:hypothetical protein
LAVYIGPDAITKINLSTGNTNQFNISHSANLNDEIKLNDLELCKLWIFGKSEVRLNWDAGITGQVSDACFPTNRISSKFEKTES